MQEERMPTDDSHRDNDELTGSPSPASAPPKRAGTSCAETIYIFLFGLLVLHGPYVLLAFSQRLEVGRDGRIIDDTSWYLGYGIDAMGMQIFIFPILLFISYGISALIKGVDTFRIMFLGLNSWTALVFLNYLYATPPAIKQFLGVPKGSLLIWGFFFLIGLIFLSRK